ncbi:MAG: hypothetical protein HJJLKODD_01213 [Phycisphaerae bacterium]|nr:hypothetical protein [Phycisphaerae bacterium]
MSARSESATQLTFPSEHEIELVRVVQAPAALVWKAWTSPEHLARWWGPNGFRTTTRAMELRPGGSWRFVMHGPDGTDYDNLITFLEMDEPRRLVYKHGGEVDSEPVNFEVTVSFTPSADQHSTIITMRSRFPSAQARDYVIREYGAAEGGRQHLARLDEYLVLMLSESTDSNHVFVISRVFQAPRETVWQAWTRQENLARWFGPQGTTIPRCTLDFQVGGIFHYCMRSADGSEHWGKWVFREITPPERLEFVISFADAQGRAVRAFFDEQWPLEMLTRVTFAEHADKSHGTVVTIRKEAFQATAVEQEQFIRGMSSMQQGWGGTLDKLEAYCQH